MGEDWLNVLILLYYHKDIPLDYGQIVNRYACRHPRRMTFLYPLVDDDAEDLDDSDGANEGEWD